MSDSKLLCRLCKGTEFLCNLYDIDGDTSLLEKTNLCIGFEISRDDGLPSMICKFCKKKIKKFYTFKRKCLRVDIELKILNNQLTQSKVKIENNKELIDENDKCSLEISPSGNMKIDITDVNSRIFHVTEESCPKFNEDDKSIICELCGSIYNSKTEYRTHLSTHNGARPYQCKLCPKHFTRAESREIHMRTHLGIRPFICEICGQSSTKRQDLIRHLKIHSNERKYECHICGRRFKRSMDLLTHNRTHTGARPYKCTKCGKEYTSHSGLRKHRKIHLRN